MSYYVYESHLGGVSISEEEPCFLGFDETCDQCGDSDYTERFDSLNKALAYVLLEHGEEVVEELGYKIKVIELKSTKRK